MIVLIKINSKDADKESTIAKILANGFKKRGFKNVVCVADDEIKFDHRPNDPLYTVIEK